MSPHTELAVIYDDGMRPVAASCARCGEKMPDPGSDLATSADIIMWFSGHFLNHKRRNHAHDEYQLEKDSE